MLPQQKDMRKTTLQFCSSLISSWFWSICGPRWFFTLTKFSRLCTKASRGERDNLNLIDSPKRSWQWTQCAMQKRVYSDENRWCTCFCWIHLFGWNNKRNPWSGAAIQMEMNPRRCVCVTMWCAQQYHTEIRGDYEGCLPYHLVFTRRGGLILYTVDWRAWKLTEQIYDRALHSGVSIFPETTRQTATTKEY